MYVGLSIVKLLSCREVVSIVRKYLSDSPLFQLRESVLFLLEIVTDLEDVPPHFLVSDTPSYAILDRAILDSLYFGSSSRPSKCCTNC